MPRRSIEITGFRHANPIPAACRIGPLLVSSVVAPRNPSSETIPDAVDAQLDNLFDHVGEMLQEAGADWRHIARMTFFVPDMAVREAINRPWSDRFPEPGSRPARHTQLSSGGGKAITCDFIAYIDD